VRERPYGTVSQGTPALAVAISGCEDLMVQVVKSLLKISALSVEAATIVHNTRWRTT
jgi:hypothetical protein